MKPSDIRVGATYRNCLGGNTMRKVLSIGLEHRPRMLPNGVPDDEPGVLYSQPKRRTATLILRSFAAWAGSEVKAGA